MPNWYAADQSSPPLDRNPDQFRYVAFWAKFVGVYVFVGVGLLLLVGISWRTAIEFVVLMVPAVPYIVRQYPRLYLKLRELKYWISNSSTTWDLSLRFRGDFNPDDIEALVRNLLSRRGPAGSVSTLREESAHRWILSYQRNLPLEVSVSRPAENAYISDYDGWELHVGLLPIPIGYRESQRVLEQDLIPLLEWIKDQTRANWGSYSLRVHFSDGNPFFGLYVERLSLDLVDTFQFEFRLPDTREESYVRVVEDEMSVTSSTVQGLRRAARAALAFQAPSR